MTDKQKLEIIDLKKEGFTYEHIAKKFNYSIGYIKQVISRYKKDKNLYNEDHRKIKYELNKEFFKEIKPKSILDLFCGENRFWDSTYGKRCKVISNDSLESKNAKPDPGMTLKANLLLQAYSSVNYKFDLIDIDPYGSPISCLENGIKLAKKGLIVTFGDYKNFKRYSNKYRNHFKVFYNIDLPKEEITINNLIDYVINLSKGTLEVWYVASWKTCDRIYFIKKKE